MGLTESMDLVSLALDSCCVVGTASIMMNWLLWEWKY